MTDNLFKNASFEDGATEIPGHENIRYPAEWFLWYADESNFNKWDENNTPFSQPEAHVLHKSDIPPNEWDDFFVDGEHTWKCFGRHRSIWIQLTQLVELEACSYRFGAHVFPDLVARYDNGTKVAATDPQSGMIRLAYGENVTGWKTMLPYLSLNHYEWEFDMDEPGAYFVGVEILLPHPLTNNGFFADAFELVALSTPPPREYERTTHLVPQDTMADEYQQVVEKAYPAKQSVLFSADDALINHPNLTTRTVHAWAAQRFGGEDALREFAEKYYPPQPNWVWHQFEQPESNWERFLYWQKDARWRDTVMGGPDCRLTIGDSGCYITCIGMACDIFADERGMTPAEVNDILGADGYTVCRANWSTIKDRLQIRITPTGDPEAHLDAGGLLMAEVQPTSLEHFVLVVEKAGNDWLALDPLKNRVDTISNLGYAGVESWRFLTEVDEPSPPHVYPVPKTLLSLHLQESEPDWPDWVGAVQPNVFKLVGEFERASEVKAASPDTLVWIRQVDNDTGKYIGTQPNGYLDKPPPDVAARMFLDTFWPQGEIPSWFKDVDIISGLNETIATGNTAGTRSAVAFEVAFSDLVASLGTHIKASLLATAVGNPGHNEVELLLPAAEAAVRNGHYIDDHLYVPCNLVYTVQWLLGEGLHHHMRSLLSWDPVFNADGLYPLYLAGECGAIGAYVREDGRPGGYIGAGAGFRHPDCLNGDWIAYLNLLLAHQEMIEEWNKSHGYRFRGMTMFTVGGPGDDWENFELDADQLAQLADALT